VDLPPTIEDIGEPTLSEPNLTALGERKWIRGEDTAGINLNLTCPNMPQERVIYDIAPGIDYDCNPRQQPK
jgi:hypothetical protein